MLLAGRFAGRKAVVMSVNEDGKDDKKFGHAIGKHCVSLSICIEIIY